MLDARVTDAIRECRQLPELARLNTTEDVGGCLASCRVFALALETRAVPYAIRRYRTPPGWRTRQHHVTVTDGYAVDWIGPQYRPGSGWPDVRPVDAFQQDFGPPLRNTVCPRCGSPGDLGRDLRLRPLRKHRCPGPDPAAHERRIIAVLDGLPPLQRAQLARKLGA
jgi:hypothetical protein